MSLKLLTTALSSTNDPDHIQQLKFSKAYMTKLFGVESGDKEMLKEGNNQLKALCKEEYPPALVFFT